MFDPAPNDIHTEGRNNGNINNNYEQRSSSSTTSRTSWQSKKEEGKRYYANENYEQALYSFQSALEDTVAISKRDRQIILSNIIACRLKLATQRQDISQARAAIDSAQRCIDLDPTWSKAHVRLASAYITTQSLISPTSRLYSNDACNALQTALRYDPSNTTARQMLLRELRSRDESDNTQQQPQQSNRDPPINPNYQQQTPGGPQSPRNETSSSRRSFQTDNDHGTGIEEDDVINPHGTTVRDWIGQCYDTIEQTIRSWKLWYDQQSSDFQTGILILLFLLILYVAFGGRFGFGGGQPTLKGNYGPGNAYDQYGRRQQQKESYHNQYNDGHSSSSYYNNNSYGDSNSNSSFNDLFAPFGGFQNFAIMAVVLYICHKNGINPLMAWTMINTVTGRYRGNVGFGGYNMGGGWGGYNMRGAGGGGYGGGFGGMYGGGGGGGGGGHRRHRPFRW